MLQVVCVLCCMFFFYFFFFSILQLAQIRGAQYQCYVSMKIIEILSRAKIIIRFLQCLNVSFFAEFANTRGFKWAEAKWYSKTNCLRVVVKTIREEEKQNKTLCVWGLDGARLPAGAARSLVRLTNSTIRILTMDHSRHLPRKFAPRGERKTVLIFRNDLIMGFVMM